VCSRRVLGDTLHSATLRLHDTLPKTCQPRRGIAPDASNYEVMSAGQGQMIYVVRSSVWPSSSPPCPTGAQPVRRRLTGWAERWLTYFCTLTIGTLYFQFSRLNQEMELYLKPSRQTQSLTTLSATKGIHCPSAVCIHGYVRRIPCRACTCLERCRGDIHVARLEPCDGSIDCCTYVGSFSEYFDLRY
jgi:hypothetical protein